MRLIDAEAFIEYLGLDAENARKENIGEIVTLEDFDRQPTAYDVDKVIKDLEEYAHSDICSLCRSCRTLDDIDNIECENCGALGALEIVKSGGIHG